MAYNKFKHIDHITKSKKVKGENKKQRRRFNHNRHQSHKLSVDQKKKKNRREWKIKIHLEKEGVNFIWQKPYWDKTRYVCVDFYFPDSNLILEIDGYSHNTSKGYDDRRTKYLIETHGVKEVLRISNNQVDNNINDVIDLLFDKL